MQKIIIVGTTGAGKSTLAEQLSQNLNLTRIELDALFWNADWQSSENHEFREKVAEAMQSASEGWVMDGNYSIARDLTWSQADTIIWLDYSLSIIYWRLFIRTVKRVVTRQLLWGTNRETFRQAFLSKESLFYWAYTVHDDRREKYNRIIANDDYPHINFIVFSHPRATQTWLNSLPDV